MRLHAQAWIMTNSLSFNEHRKILSPDIAEVALSASNKWFNSGVKNIINYNFYSLKIFKKTAKCVKIVPSSAEKHTSSAIQLPNAFEMALKSANGVLITRLNINELTEDQILSFSSKEYWHKFILENGGLYEKDIVLQAVLDSLTPYDLVPVKYTVEGKNSYFLSRNCGQAIEKFCLNLLVPIKMKDVPGEVVLSIQTCCTPIEEYNLNMQLQLKKAIQKRHSENHIGFIDLSSFHKEPELYDVMFCPLSRPRFLVYVLGILKKILKVRAIRLSDNDIEVLTALEVLQEFTELRSLDLSNNKINDLNLTEILGKSTSTLEELNLTGNPVCGNFKTDLEYIKWIRDKIPSIKKVDGVVLRYGLQNRQIYLCTDEAGEFVNAFLGHYFTLYDRNRKALERTYEKSGMFSMTSDDDFSQYFVNKMGCYLKSNLLSGDNKTKKTLKLKNTDISKLFFVLPTTVHDPTSFKVDVLVFQEECIILRVTGIFKEILEVAFIKSFSKTLVLRKITKFEYQITNDLYHVRQATEEEIKNSFSHSKIKCRNINQFLVNKEQNLIEAASQITKMNSAYSKRCLMDCDWNLTEALQIFLENYESLTIPQEAFD